MRRAVVFDLFNTLVPGGDGGERDRVCARMARELAVDPDAYAGAFLDSWPERCTGALGDVAATVQALAVRVGGSPTPEQVAHATALRRAMTARLIGRVSAGTLAVLDTLRAGGWRLGLVSNATAESPDAFHQSPLAARFTAVAFSSTLGLAKPGPAIYLAACDRLGVGPESCVYVGDGADRELLAASALGMQVIRTTEHAETDPTWTGFTIGTLAALPTMLAATPQPATIHDPHQCAHSPTAARADRGRACTGPDLPAPGRRRRSAGRSSRLRATPAETGPEPSASLL